jgi:tetratricopeptide (TPR) repeat protein
MNLATQVCRDCGFENPRAFRACASCGHTLVGSASSSSKPGRTGLSDGPTDATIVAPPPFDEATLPGRPASLGGAPSSGGSSPGGSSPGAVSIIGAPSSGAPSSAAPSSAAPSSAAPSSGAPSSGAPSSAAPSSAAPSSGAPSSGAPSSGAPSSGAPSSGAPSSAAPSSAAGSPLGATLLGAAPTTSEELGLGPVSVDIRIQLDDREPPLIGQVEASAAIRAGIETAFQRGVPTLVALEGGAGSGRTRLLFHAAELAAKIRGDVRILYGLCREGDGPNAPFSRMLLERFGVTPSSSPAAVRGQMATIVAETLRSTDAITVSETAHLLGHLSGVPFPDSPFLMPLEDRPEELRRRARDAVARFLGGDASQRPLVVLIDNIHLAESDAWDLLQVILSVAAPIAVVVTGEAPFGDRAESMNAEGGVVLGPIAPLAESEIGALLHVMLPSLRQPVEPLVAALAHRSRGNAGALRELVFALIEAGLFTRTEQGLIADLSQLEGGALPVTTEDAIHARLARLDDLERATIDRASVVGEVASDRAVLAQMRSERRAQGNRGEPETLWPHDDDEVALGDALRRLEQKGFLEHLEESDIPGAREYRFLHSESRHFVYRAQGEELVKKRHATVAHWITVTLELQREGIAAMAAPHLEKAGMANRAGRAYLEAAKDELAKMHTQSALRHVEKALELIAADEISRRIDALHVLGSLLTTLGRYDEATSAFAEMLETSWRVGARGKGGAALNRIARVHRMRGEEEQAKTLLVRALQLFRAAQDLRGVASTLDDLAQVERLRGDLDAAASAATEALDIRRSHGDVRGEAVSLTTLGLIEHARGNLDVAEQSFRAALEIRESIGDRAGVMQSFNTLGIVAFERGDLERAEGAWRAALQEGRKMADRRTQTFVLNNLGEALGKSARYDEAHTCLVEARTLAHELGDRRAMAEVERNLGLVALHRGDERAEEILSSALRMAEEYGAKESIAAAHRAVGQLRAQTVFGAGTTDSGGADRRAEDSFLIAIDLFREIGNEKDSARALHDLGQHLLERGDVDGARERLREARAIMRRMGLAELERVEATLLHLG